MTEVGQALDGILRELVGPPERVSGELPGIARPSTAWPAPEGSPQAAPIATRPYLGAPPARSRPESATAPQRSGPALAPPRSGPALASSIGTAGKPSYSSAPRLPFILAGFFLGAVLAAVAVALVLGT